MIAQAPERVTRLALVAGNPNPDPPDTSARRWTLLERAERNGARLLVERDLWPSYVAVARQNDATLRASIGDMAETEGAGALREQTAIAINRFDSRPRLPRITVPTLAVAGAEDQLCPPERAREIMGAVPCSMSRVLSGVGHFVPLEAPDELAHALMGWLARN